MRPQFRSKTHGRKSENDFFDGLLEPSKKVAAFDGSIVLIGLSIRKNS